MTWRRAMTPLKTIIPIASGKGGVGKSIFSANLAIALARLGHPTVAVDLDLGGIQPPYLPGHAQYPPGHRGFPQVEQRQI